MYLPAKALHRKIVSETIGLRLIKIVAFTIYAPADRFFRIELSRVNEATFYGISIFWLLPDYNKIKAKAPSNSLLFLKYLHFYVTQIDLLWEAVLIVFSLIISTQHIPAVYSTRDRDRPRFQTARFPEFWQSEIPANEGKTNAKTLGSCKLN